MTRGRPDHAATDAPATSGPATVAVDPPTDADLQASLPYRVRFDEAGPTGAIRTSVLLRFAADLAAVHSERRGFGRPWYRESGLAWLVRGVDLELHAPIVHGDTIVGTTRAVAARKVLARRRTEFDDPAGGRVATVIVDWAMTTAEGAATRIPPIFDSVFGKTVRTFEPIRVRPAPPAGSSGHVLRVRPQELDPMAHVNNAVYLDWAEEAIRAADPGRAAAIEDVPRRWRLEYLGAAGASTRVRAFAWPDGPAWSVRIEDADSGEPLVGAHLTV